MEHAATSMLNNLNGKILARKIPEINKSKILVFVDCSFLTERVDIEMLFFSELKSKAEIGSNMCGEFRLWVRGQEGTRKKYSEHPLLLFIEKKILETSKLSFQFPKENNSTTN